MRADLFIDIDPRKVGRTARGAPIVDPERLLREPRPFVLVAVGAAGARDEVRSHLAALGYLDGEDVRAVA